MIQAGAGIQQHEGAKKAGFKNPALSDQLKTIKESLVYRHHYPRYRYRCCN